MSKVPIRKPKHKLQQGEGITDFRNFQEAQDAIDHANNKRDGYYTVRTLQQAYPSHLPAVQQHIRQYKDCKQCPLGCSPMVHNKVIFRGYIPCDVLFIGEAPGKNENTVARPFVGECGRVVDDIITAVSHRLIERRDNAFRWCVTNSVLCMPYDDGETRTPTAEEVKTCNHRLLEFINICSPSVIVSMGNVANRAIQYLTKNGEFCMEISFLGGESYKPIHLNVPHPSWMLRQKKDKQLYIKKAVLAIHAVIKPLFQIG